MDELQSHIDDLEKLKYLDLQKLAKKFGIRANLKGDKIITSLRELAVNPKHATFNTTPNKSEQLESQEETTDVELNVNVRRGRKTKKLTKGVKQSHAAKQQSSDEDDVIQFQEAKSPDTRNSVTQSSSRTSLSAETVKSLKPQTPVMKLNTEARKSVKTPTIRAAVAKKANKKTTPARLSTPTLSRPNLKTPVRAVISANKAGLTNTPVSALKKSKSTPHSVGKKTTPKVHTPTTNKQTTPAQQKESKGMIQTETPKDETEPVRHRSRRDTYTTEEASPGVKDIILSMKHDMTSEEQKEVLLAKLEEKVQQKNVDVPTTASQIPRYTGHGTAESEKKNPGKDWAKIHRRKWDKMDSIVDYLAKKRKRAESMTQSVKKLKMMTEQMRANLDSLKKPKTPMAGSQKKQLSIQKQSVGEVSKMVKSKTALFQSPAPAVFKPKVTSVSKANFVFCNTYTKDQSIFRGCKTLDGNSKSPSLRSTTKALAAIGKGGHSVKKACKENVTLDTRKSTNSVNKRISAVDSSFKHTTNIVPMSNTKKFDITASLARPITWQTHKGKLKPFNVEGLSGHQTEVKEVKVKSRVDRRKENMRRQKDNRKDNLAQRRGIHV